MDRPWIPMGKVWTIQSRGIHRDSRSHNPFSTMFRNYTKLVELISQPPQITQKSLLFTNSSKSTFAVKSCKNMRSISACEGKYSHARWPTFQRNEEKILTTVTTRWKFRLHKTVQANLDMIFNYCETWQRIRSKNGKSGQNIYKTFDRRTQFYCNASRQSWSEGQPSSAVVSFVPYKMLSWWFLSGQQKVNNVLFPK